ncbi:MAG: hypothetical protein WDN45_14570 [Caulobacteraceae bacterium]
MQAFAGAPAIRAAHPRSRITLLTLAPFAPFARASGLFDAVEADAIRRSWISALGTWAACAARASGGSTTCSCPKRRPARLYALLPNAAGGVRRLAGLGAGGRPAQPRQDRQPAPRRRRRARMRRRDGPGPRPWPGCRGWRAMALTRSSAASA